MTLDDTIIAISSAVGASARMIVRASGPLVRAIHRNLTGFSQFSGSAASRTRVTFGNLTIPAWVYTFASPASVTGEDVLELHVPGNPVLARMLLDELVRTGARQAEPGEFTARGYFNGKLDLAEAEGVAATIAAQSERELKAARQLLSGELARRLRPVLDRLTDTLGLVEVGIDFVEEDVSFISQDQLRDRIVEANERLDRLLSDSARFERICHEPHVVLIGRPNAGKSTLLNTLAGTCRAVVSSQPGTTRDAIWTEVRLPRGTVRLIDVAGIEHDGASDEISQLMQRRACEAMNEADVVVLVRDCTDSRPAPQLPRATHLLVATKLDLLQVGCAVGPNEIGISAIRGDNLGRLRELLDGIAFGSTSSGGATLALNARHVQAIEEARSALDRALGRSHDSGAELIALELREALDALGRILGGVTPDEVLDRIFSTFCIGK
jgi:tRNA modification GTPase